MLTSIKGGGDKDSERQRRRQSLTYAKKQGILGLVDCTAVVIKDEAIDVARMG